MPFSFVYEVESLLKETVILGTNDKANFECQGNEQQQNANAHTGGTVKIPGLWLTQMYALLALNGFLELFLETWTFLTRKCLLVGIYFSLKSKKAHSLALNVELCRLELDKSKD